MESCTLPEEAMCSILMWLPVISLLRFRSVCKTWRALIDSSFFINQHLLHGDDNSNGSLIICAEDAEWFGLFGHHFEERVNFALSTLLPLHFYEDNGEGYTFSSFSSITCCNGIICLSCDFPSGKLRVALWNPATRQLARLPEPPLLSPQTTFCEVVFGYDVKADVYKVFQVGVFLDTDNSTDYCQVQAYNLQSGIWRNIEVDLPCGLTFIFNQRASWKGHFSWVVDIPKNNSPDTIYLILSFNLSDQVFEIMELPDVLSTKKWEPHLATIGDSVACIDRMRPYELEDHHFDIWVLKEYGVKESWTKLYTTELIGPFTVVRPEGLSMNGKFMIFSCEFESGYHLILWDPNSKEFKNLPTRNGYVTIYKETLVSVKKTEYL